MATATAPAPTVLITATPGAAVATATANNPTGQIAGEVPRYGLFEKTLTSTNSYSNKFTDVDVYMHVTTPTQGVVIVRGFYDGDGAGAQTGNVWKARYMPTETGSHSYETKSSDAQLNGVTGDFDCVAALTSNPYAQHGPVHIHPTKRHAVAHHDGTPFFWNGDTEWFFLTHDATKIDQTEREDAIDFLEGKKVNNLLMTMVNSDSAFYTWPWPGTTSPTNHTSFQLDRLKQWEDTILYMQAAGIIADLWFYSDDSTGVMPSAYSADEDLYFEYILARLGAYSNVTWNLGLEYTEYRSANWVESRAQKVKFERPEAFLSVHQVGDATYDFPGNRHLDHTSLQDLASTHDTINAVVIDNREDTLAAGRAIPIFHEEFAIEGADNPDPVVQRKCAWAVATGGGFFKGASLGFWIGTLYTSATHFGFLKTVYETVTKCQWWLMSPMNSLVQSGGSTRYCLGRIGPNTGELLAYSTTGSTFDLDLSSFTGTCTVEYTDPTNGSTSGGTLSGGATRTVTNPFGSGEVSVQVTGSTLLVHGAIRADAIVPSATGVVVAKPGAAAATATANDVTGDVAGPDIVTPNAAVATATAASPTAAIQAPPAPGQATATAAAPTALVSATPAPGIATASSENPTALITARPGAAVATATAPDPTVSGTSTANADPAAATATAPAPTARVGATPVAGVATATGNNPGILVTATPGSAVATATANNPSTGGTTTAEPGAAVATATSPAPTARVHAPPSAASALATANDLLARLLATVAPGVATATAPSPTGRVVATPGAASATATAPPVTTTPAGGQDTATPASAAATANVPAPSGLILVLPAAAIGDANAPTPTVLITVTCGAAAASAVAPTQAPAVVALPGSAIATGDANTLGGLIVVLGSPAVATATVNDLVTIPSGLVREIVVMDFDLMRTQTVDVELRRQIAVDQALSRTTALDFEN